MEQAEIGPAIAEDGDYMGEAFSAGTSMRKLV